MIRSFVLGGAALATVLASPAFGETLQQAMRRADAAMYRAKATGRALIVVADGDLLPS